MVENYSYISAVHIINSSSMRFPTNSILKHFFNPPHKKPGGLKKCTMPSKMTMEEWERYFGYKKRPKSKINQLLSIKIN